MMAAFVTPVIMDYGERHPAVWSWVLLPVYMAGPAWDRRAIG